MTLFKDTERTAWISDCGRYRHSLGRHWDSALGFVLFIGLNPSTADAEKDDPTIRRCMRFAKDWGYGGIEMCNLYDWRSTDPKLLPRDGSEVSAKNDSTLREKANASSFIVAAWGRVPWAATRIDEVFKTVFTEEKRWHTLKLTKEGFPSHPLYIAADTKPIVYW